MLFDCIKHGIKDNEENLYRSDLMLDEQGGVRSNTAISLIRAIATMAIIICHIMQYLNLELAWWFNVGVQIFFTMSGFLYGQKIILSPLEFYRKQFKKILLPYWIYLFFAVTVYIVFSPDSISIKSIFLAFICGDVIQGLGHLWFIPYILFCYLLTPVLQYFADELIKYSSKCFLIALVVLLLFVNVYSVLYCDFRPDRTSCFFIGYFLGVYFTNYERNFFRNITFFLIAVAVCMNAIRVCIKYLGFISINTDQSLFVYFERYSHACLGIALFLGFYLIFQPYARMKIKVVSFIDKNSYEVYLTHHLFILSPMTLMNLTRYTGINICVVLISAFASAIILKYVVNFFNKYILMPKRGNNSL